MAKSRNAVKRCGKGGKRPGQNYAQVIQERIDSECRIGGSLGKIMQEEMMLIAMKRMGILGTKRLQQLDRTLREIRQTYSRLYAEDVSPDGNNDKDFDYTKGKYDEEFMQAVGPENFVPWEWRHSLDYYSDGIRTIAARRIWDMQQEEKKRKLQELEEAQNARARIKEALENGI